jgi:hypothetical protein
MSSRSNIATTLKNPAKFFFEWSSKHKTVTFYKKPEAEGEKGETITMNLPFRFLPLSILATVKGFNKTAKSSYWSNEVKSTKTDTLYVKYRKDRTTVNAIKGLWEEIRDSREIKGSRFAQSIYIMWKDKDGKSVLANLTIDGGAVGKWFDFKQDMQKKYNDWDILLKKGVEISGFKEEVNGDTVYYDPIFKLIEVSEESNNQAIAIDRELQLYLSEYFKKSGTTDEQETETGATRSQYSEEVPPPSIEDEPEVNDNEENTPWPETGEDIPF